MLQRLVVTYSHDTTRDNRVAFGIEAVHHALEQWQFALDSVTCKIQGRQYLPPRHLPKSFLLRKLVSTRTEYGGFRFSLN